MELELELELELSNSHCSLRRPFPQLKGHCVHARLALLAQFL
jgi:hypothetical protein